ncbi:DUF4276 family protein [Isoptericola halotolerans]|uniref:DUF4276 family protein n=1 Tax=Isoptericola halotolerans TaxID=300560 RepID=UPI00389083EF
MHSLPRLLQRIAWERHGVYVDALKPHRVPRANMVRRPEGFRNAVRLQASRVAGRGGVLVLADSDDDPADLLWRLDESVREAKASRPVIVTLAVREFEAWLLAGIESLRAHRSVTDDAAFDGDPEEPRNPKGRLEQLMDESYGSVRHQVAFGALLDIDQAADRSPSFAPRRRRDTGRGWVGS